MKVLDRLIFFLTAIGLLALSCGLIIFALNFISPTLFTYWSRTFYQGVAGRQEVGIVGLLFLLGGMRLGHLGLAGQRKKAIIVQETNLGTVKVSLVAVENLICKLMRSLPAVREVKPSIQTKKGEASVTLRLSVIPETNVPQLTERIQTLVEEGVRDVLGIKVCQVKVLIDKMLADTTRVE